MKKNKALIVTMMMFLDGMAREEALRGWHLHLRQVECVREKGDSRFLVCMKGRIMVSFTEMRKTKGGGHLGGANQEFWFGCIRGHLDSLSRCLDGLSSSCGWLLPRGLGRPFLISESIPPVTCSARNLYDPSWFIVFIIVTTICNNTIWLLFDYPHYNDVLGKQEPCLSCP